MFKIILKPGKEKPVLGWHPWIFSGAIGDIKGDIPPGEIVSIHSANGEFLAKGYYNPHSQIAVRILSFKDETIDLNFFRLRIENALDSRKSWLSPDTNAFRVVHSEGDFLPGLIVDRYADFLVVQFLTLGMDRLKGEIVEALKSILPCLGIFEKDDVEVRSLEGLPERLALLAGEAPPELIPILEHGLKFLVDVHGGQKTGFFLDQKENRLLVSKQAREKRVLNLFSYTGAFSIYAARGGAREIVSVDSSQPALDIAAKNVKANELDPSRFQFHRDDVFEFLRRHKNPYDLIILDPPHFAPTRGSVLAASRAYKDINRLALKLLAPGGLLFTYSCSHHVDSPLFQKILFAAAKEAQVEVRILVRTSHPFDHPVSIYHPEGEYLKGFVLSRKG